MIHVYLVIPVLVPISDSKNGQRMLRWKMTAAHVDKESAGVNLGVKAYSR